MRPYKLKKAKKVVGQPSERGVLQEAAPGGNRDATTSPAQGDRKKRKRKQKRDATEKDQPLTVEPQKDTQELAAKKKKKKRKRLRDPAGEASLAPEELERRKRQKLLRGRALKLRAEGKEYNKWKARRQLEVAQGGPRKVKERQQGPAGLGPAYVSGRDMGHKARHEDEAGFRPEGDVQVIIVPIYWNKNKEEKAAVVAAADRIEAMLSEAGIASGVDTTNKLMPGQKFRFWEEKGVKLRVELGPKDVERTQAVLAVTATPGELARKTTYPATQALVKAVQRELGMPLSSGLPMDDADAGHKEPAPVSFPAAAKTQDGSHAKHQEHKHAASPPQVSQAKPKDKKHAKLPERSQGKAQEARHAPPPAEAGASPCNVPVEKDARDTAGEPAKAKQGPLVGSGDDLLDDFGDLDPLSDFDDDETAAKRKKKKKKPRLDEKAADWGAAAVVQHGKRVKGPKVVVF